MVVCDALLVDGSCDVAGFVGEAAGGSRTVMGLPVFASLDDLHDAANLAFVAAVGDNYNRQREFERARARGLRPRNAVHPSAVVSPRCELGAGVMVIAGVVVNVAARIEDNVILNTGCSVDHHCRIGAHAHIAPGARLAGNVAVGTLTLVGAGAVILPGVTVGARCVVAAGAVVTRDVPDGCTAVGMPARIAGEATA
jgi:sugar O-acyltransferase (sialic acid O-acetyltransferase NeuD family)